MVQCFAPDCQHHSESHDCRFFAFPNPEKKKAEYDRWKKLIRRGDKDPNKHSRLCSGHFRDGNKAYGPEIFQRNSNKLFPSDSAPLKKKAKSMDKPTAVDVRHIVEAYNKKENEEASTASASSSTSTTQVILEAEVQMLKRDLREQEKKEEYTRKYTVQTLSERVLRMETGLPTKTIFDIVVLHVLRYRDSINYFSGWKVDSISFEDQILITLMKVRQNYTNLHLAQLFSCSVATISNIVTTFVHVLHKVLFNHLMCTIPSRDKNKTNAPSSFSQFSSCRIIIDCTDIEIATPGLMCQQNSTYSSYRGMNSFKVMVGVAPNGVITYVSSLFPGSSSDKAIVEKSGLLGHLDTGDLILADKGFLIQDIVPNGVYVNIPPFLNNGKFTESEARATKSIAKCRIHVERANARLKDFKMLTFIPSYLRCYAEKLFQLCAALVNLQFPLIKEGCEDIAFD